MRRVSVNARGWGHCTLCDEYLTPAQVRRHVRADGSCRPPRERHPVLTLGEAAWGPGGSYEDDSRSG